MTVILSTAYWPNLHYFYYILNSEKVCIEQFENFQKQSFRNRTQILTANGPLDLSVPVKKRAPKELTKDIEISYSENWQIKHWRAITSAYKNSPYFDYFEEEIHYFYSKPFERLLDYNRQQAELVLKLLKIKKDISYSTGFEKDLKDTSDMRFSIHPKINLSEDPVVRDLLQVPYYQTFGEKFQFYPNPAILDLLFNTGLETKNYLHSRG